MKKKGKILVFAPLYPPHVGGLENHAAQWNTHLGQAGYTITVWTPRVVASSSAHEQQADTTIIRFPAWEIIPNYPVPKFWQLLFWQQVYQLWQTPPDLIVSRTRFFITSLFALVYAKIRRIPWLHIEHGSDYVHLNHPVTHRLAKLWDHTLGRLVFIAATTIVANSSASAAFVKKLAPSRQVTVIYRGLDIPRLHEITPAQQLHQQYSNQTLITYVGRLIDGKGIRTLLQAITLLANPSAHLLLVGDGPQRSELQKQAQEYQISSQTTFLGEKSWEEAMAILKISDIVVNPSFTEGLPTSIIEAALCRRAIVASHVGGTPEVITTDVSGLLIPPGQPKLLANALQKLLGNRPLRLTLAQKAYTENLSRFSWTTAAAQYDMVLQTMLSR